MRKFNMQNIIIWIKNDKGGYKFRYRDDFDKMQRYLKLQIEHSINLGWLKEDIVVITNFPFEYMGVKANVATDICGWSAFANKLVVINEMIKRGIINDNFWLHDADAYQLVPFNFPQDCNDVGYVRHAPGRNKLQGGSAFFRKEAFDIVEVIATGNKLFRITKEESFFSVFFEEIGGAKVIKKYGAKWTKVKNSLKCSKKKKNQIREQYRFAKRCFGKYRQRFGWLNYTYNLSQQRMFARKYPKAEKPIKVVHFHTEYVSTMNCFYKGLNNHKVKIVTDDLEKMFIKHGFISSDEQRC